jgi:hypothetical protein
MSYIPNHSDGTPPVAAARHAIIVFALKENKRPVGFAPWPDNPDDTPQPTDSKPKRHKKKKQLPPR